MIQIGPTAFWIAVLLNAYVLFWIAVLLNAYVLFYLV